MVSGLALANRTHKYHNEPNSVPQTRKFYIIHNNSVSYDYFYE